MARLFGTDGVRGVVNDTLTPELAFHLGRVAATYFSRQHTAPRFLIGRDTRISGTMLMAALAAGICSVGGAVDDAGVIPTPGVAYLTKRGRYAAGVMISASHNPFPDNGIKFFDSQGFKLPDETEDELELMLRQTATAEYTRPTGADIGVITPRPDLVQRYIDYVVATAPVRLDGMKIVTDTANGAASTVTPKVLETLGATVIALSAEPNGVNINDDCGSTHPARLQEAVKAHGAAAGIANDGDADRCIMVDEHGELVDGDRILYLCALHLQAHDALPDNTVVATVMSNIGLEKSLATSGIHLERTAVGDRYVLERMREHGYMLGGEQSGHVIFLRHNTTGDGVLTAVQVLGMMRERHATMGELTAGLVIYPQLLVNVPTVDKHAWESDPVVQAAIAAGTDELGDDGHILVRASGTESLVRVMAEGPSEEQLKRIVGEIADAIARDSLAK